MSLTVTTKHRTEPGAAALCSASLAGVIGRIVTCVLPSPHATGSPRKHENTSRLAHYVRCLELVVACFRVRRCSRGRASSAAAPRDPFRLDQAAERWVTETQKKLTLDEKIGQLIVPTFESNLSQQRQRHVRIAGAPRARIPRERLPCVWRVAARATGSAESWLRHGDSRSAAVGGVSRQSPAGDVRCPLAEHRRLRDRRRVPAVRRHGVSAADGDGGDRTRRRRAAGAGRGTDHRCRVAGDGDPRELRAGGRCEQQPAQPRDQHAILRRGSGARRRARRRLRSGRARRRDDRDDQAFPRARRHRRRQSYRSAGGDVRPRPARSAGAGAVQARRGAGRRGGHGRAHRAARARSHAVDAGHVQRAGAPPPVARRARIRRPRLHRLDVDGRRGEDAAARRRRRARRSRRRGSRAALAGSDCRVQGREGGDRRWTDQRSAPRRVGGARAARKGVRRPARAARD